MGTIGAIEKTVVIVVIVNPNLKTWLRLLESTQLITQIRIIVTGYLKKMIKTWIKSPIIIVTKKAILLISAPSLRRQKASIGHGNFHVNDWHW